MELSRNKIVFIILCISCIMGVTLVMNFKDTILWQRGVLDIRTLSSFFNTQSTGDGLHKEDIKKADISQESVQTVYNHTNTITRQESVQTVYHHPLQSSNADPKPCQEHIPSFEASVVDQFEHILTQKPDFTRVKTRASAILEQFRKYRHSVQTGKRCVQDNMDYMVLKIKEEKSIGELSKGGSGFMVRVEHVYLVVCPVIDHFNGTYSVYCPMYNQRCGNFSILIKHINFSGFNGRTYILEKSIWKERICKDLDTAQRSHIPILNLLDRDRPNQDTNLTRFPVGLPVPQSHGHWVKYSGQWKWVGSKGQVLPLQHNKTMCECYKRFHRTYILGASHMDINRGCLNNLCKGSDLQFVWARIIKLALEKLPSILSDISKDPVASQRYQIIMQLGSWDLNQFPFQDVMYSWIPKLQATLRNLTSVHRDLFESARVKLLVVSSPSLPDIDRIGKNFGPKAPVSHELDRNNWISAVFAHTLRKHIETVPYVEFLDEFEFTFPLYWFVYSWPNYPNHHYSMWSGKTRRCPGHVGNAFLGRMVMAVCPDIPMV